MKTPDSAVEMALRGEVLSRAAGEVVHDAKNPLHALSIHLGILAEKIAQAGGVLPGLAEKNVNAIRDQIQKVDRFLKALARMGQRGVGESADVAGAIHESVPFLAHQAKRRVVEITVEAPEGLRAATSQALLQDLVGLLALAAMETGGGPILEIAAKRDPEGMILISAERNAEAPALAAPDVGRERALRLCNRAAESCGGSQGWNEGSAWVRLPGVLAP